MRRFWSLLIGVVVVALVGGGLTAPPIAASPPGSGTTGGGASRAPARVEPKAPPVVAAPPAPATKRRPLSNKRVREVTASRSEYGSVFELADGRSQTEISATPQHFRDRAGHWQKIDRAVRAVEPASDLGRAGFVHGNSTNNFGSAFGGRTDRLARFDFQGHHVTIGLPGARRATAPTVSGDTVTFPGLLPDADLTYQVGSGELKELIVLAQKPADPTWTFTVDAPGLRTMQREDGAIAFFDAKIPGPALFAIPAPYMFDASDPQPAWDSPARSDKVSQSFVRHGSTLEVTVRADAAWLADPKREYPVRIDPTIKIEPTPTTSQDTMIYSGNVTDNFDDEFRLDVGTSAAIERTLVKFPLTNIPANVPLSSAVLQMYFDQTFGNDANTVPLEAHRATAAWTASTATWSNASANVGELGGTATKAANQWGTRHSYTVTNIVQSWVNGTQPNHGFVLKVANEALLNQGGPRYEASIFAYNGETSNRPKLLLTWGRPSVAVDPVTVTHATGAELAWGAYTDPSPATGDDAVEYQVHRSVFQTFTPGPSTLVAPLPTTQRTFTDTTAVPTPADVDDDLGDKGNAYYYMVAVKTRDGELIPSSTRVARLPKAGKVFRTIFASADTTLAQGQPDTTHDILDGHADLDIGNGTGDFGLTRTLLKFPPLTGVSTSGQVTAARIRMWSYFTAPATGSSATYELRPMFRDFDEATATWNRANSTTPWTFPGGDSGAVAANMGPVNDKPAWRSWNVTSLAQTWVSQPTSIRSVLIKLQNEATPREETLFLSSEAFEPELRPYMELTYTEKTTDSTYFVPSTPETMVTGAAATVPVTLTNTTTAGWTTANQVVTYRWTLPDGTDVTNTSNQVQTPLPANIAVGGTATINATVQPPSPVVEQGNKREQYTLTWDVKNKTTGQFLSQSDGIPGLAQNVAVEEPTSDQIGLEKFYQYAGQATGAGSSVLTNLYAGNTVWNYDAWSNPSRGLASFVRVTYNSQDTSDSSMGFGWSMSATSLMRLGSPLDFHPPGQSWPTTIKLTDGDGTTHTFTLNKHGSTNEALWDYDKPAGVHLYLQKFPNNDESRRWRMVAPDRTKFYFDTEGYLSGVEDNTNNNDLTFVYEQRRSNNKPVKFLKYVTDPTGRQVLTLDYYDKGESYTFIDDTGAEVSGTNLTNPKIIDHIRSITDLCGTGVCGTVAQTARSLSFVYSDKGLMAKMVDGNATTNKTFRFTYDATQGNKNVKLVKVTDPLGHDTALEYYSPPNDDPQFHWRSKTIVDRLGNPAGIQYFDPDGPQGSTIETTVTDAEGHRSTYDMDGFGRPTQMTNAKDQVTKLHYDADHNVDRLEENNGAVTTWRYDGNTGFPLEMKDAEANANGTAATTYSYQLSQNGHCAELTLKTSPEGRTWVFGYNTAGDLVSAVDPAGAITSDPNDFKTTYEYDGLGQLSKATDANGHFTLYSGFEANGYPQTITDTLTNATKFVYDPLGRVTKATDALLKDTTQNYDLFGRPLDSRVPKDQAANIFITTPGPVYDANDNVLQTSTPEGAITTAAYDNADRLVSTSMPKDTPTGPARTSTITYDKVGNVLTQTEPNGTLTPSIEDDFTTHYAYDEIYQLTQVTNAEGDRVTYAYDGVGNVTTVTDPRKNNTPDTTDVTVTTAYDRNHRVTDVTDAAGNTKSTDYDLDSNVVSTTDEEGNTTSLTLDERGMVSEARVPFKNPGGTVTYNTTRISYDQVGNQTKVESPRGVATTGVATDFVSETVYDELNRVKEQLTPFDPSDVRVTSPDRTIYSYDAVGRVAKVSAPPSNGQTVRNDTTYSYFDNGWVKSSTDPWDIATTYDYNLQGQQTSRTLTSAGGSSARTMNWEFFPDGKLKSRSDNGVPVGQRVVLVDNTDAQNVSAVGTWASVTAGSGFQGFSYSTHPAGTGTQSFTWNLTIPQDGTYEVFVKYPAATGAATDAKYTVGFTGGTTTKPVNQTTGAGTWVSLGSFAFTVDGTGQKVTLTDQATGTILADAVKLVRDNVGEVDNERSVFTYSYDPNGNQTGIADTSPGAKVDEYAIAYDGLNQVKTVQEKLAGVVKHTTGFTYNENGAPLTRTHDATVDTYEYDVRDLVSKVTNAASASDPTPKVSTYTYTARGQLLHEVKGNNNTVDYTYYLNRQLQHQVEKKPDGTVVAEHTLDYDPNGNRVSDISKVQNANNHTAYVNRTATSTYDPRDRLRSVTKTDAGTTVSSESYVHDANNNVVSQTVDSTATSFSYDRNRLQSAAIGGVAAAYNYDPFGRLDTVTGGGQVLERNTYDGFDRVVKNTKSDGGTTTYVYDPLDRTAQETTKAGTPQAKTTDFAYLGLSDKVLDETVAGETTKSYQYSPWGQRLSQVTHNTDDTTEDGYYGYNPHTDVEQVTTDSGDTKSTYGYTAYGSDETSEFSGIDQPDVQNPGAEPYNVYRFNAKRFNHTTGTYDMGFRDYNPGLNTFLTRDTYNGALNDMNLGSSPWTGNRYAYGAGNPTTNIEINGHDACDKYGGRACNGYDWNRTGEATVTDITLKNGTRYIDDGEATYINGVPYEGGRSGLSLARELDSYIPNYKKSIFIDANQELDYDQQMDYLANFCSSGGQPCGSEFIEKVLQVQFFAGVAEGLALGDDNVGGGKLPAGGARRGVAGASAKFSFVKAEIDEAKFDYLFGRVRSNKHNTDRSKENLSHFDQIGLHDSPATRRLLRDHFDGVVNDSGNIIATWTNEYGTFQKRESLLAGPGGFVKLESTWHVTDDGLRLTTVIPKR